MPWRLYCSFKSGPEIIVFALFLQSDFIESFSKIRILVQDRGGAEFLTGGILLYVEDLKRGTNKEVGPKDIFEMGSNKKQSG
jgi:hypothetical protein